MAMFQPKRRAEKILVIHTAFLGDLILATPFLAALRAEFPQCEIRFLTTAGGATLLTPNPWNIEPVIFDKRKKDSGILGLFKMAKELRAFGPDLVFSLHRSIRSSLLAKLSGAEVWGFAEAVGSFLFQGKVSRKGIANEGEKNLALLQKYLGKGDFSPFPQLAASAADQAEADKVLEGKSKFVVLAPSSVWATKRWPGERFGELAYRLWKELGRECVVVGADSPEDHAAAAALLKEAKRLDANIPILNLTGRTGLGPLKSVLSKADLVVSNDSSPLHMAIAVGTKALGIFGPTTKELGFFPLAPQGKAAVAEVKSLSCRPCGLHGHRSCPLGHFRCMLELEVDQVFSEVKGLLCP